MITRDDKDLTRHLRPRPPSQHYGIVALSIGIGLYLLILLVRAALASPPTVSQLQRSLRAAARPRVADLRHKFEGRVTVAEAHGMFIRAPECVIGNIVDARVQHDAGGNITGLVTVACVWRSPDQRTFASREEAEDAELSEEEPGKLRLTFAWTGGQWQFKGAKKLQ